MCGIAGIFSFGDNKNRFAENSVMMSVAMRNRGPDDEGYMIASHGHEKPVVFFGNDSQNYGGTDLEYIPTRPIESAKTFEGSLFFAHRRLSIIDLSPAGHQPMCTADKRFWIIYNGEIYNHTEIKLELEKFGYRFRSTSDTEVLLYAYQHWGADFLSRLNGMFALAIWDDKNKALFCARDRVGIKPFYYTVQGNNFIFASDINTIIKSGLYKPDYDLEGLYHAMSFGVAPRPMTAFKGIKALEQAHWMSIDANGTVKMDRYWEIPTGQQDKNLGEKEAIEILKLTLTESIKKRLIADVPVGTFMSGGIDSTTISAIASELHPGINAFTLGFTNDKDLNELDQAKATAQISQMNHIVKEVEAEDALNHLYNMVECYEEPFYDISPNYIISQFVSENNIKVILNGLGGDELFGGYVYYGWLLRWLLLRKAVPFLSLSRLIRPLNPISERLLGVGRAVSADRFNLAVRSFLTDSEKKNLFIDNQVSEYNTIEAIHRLYVPEDRPFSDDIERICYIDMLNNIGNHHVYRVDKFTMRFSIEGRFPFLDHELIETAFRIPSKYKVKNGILKYILRKVAEQKIHPSCLSMQKKGFDLPTASWMKGPLDSFVNQKLHELGQRDIFKPREISRIYSDWKSGYRCFRGVWQLVGTQMWFETFID